MPDGLIHSFLSVACSIADICESLNHRGHGGQGGKSWEVGFPVNSVTSVVKTLT